MDKAQIFMPALGQMAGLFRRNKWSAPPSSQLPRGRHSWHWKIWSQQAVPGLLEFISSCTGKQQWLRRRDLINQRILQPGVGVPASRIGPSCDLYACGRSVMYVPVPSKHPLERVPGRILLSLFRGGPCCFLPADAPVATSQVGAKCCHHQIWTGPSCASSSLLFAGSPYATETAQLRRRFAVAYANWAQAGCYTRTFHSHTGFQS